MPAVFVDSNVVLTGALGHQGPASRLWKFGASVTYLHSPQVLRECMSLIESQAHTGADCDDARRLVIDYLGNLRSRLVPDSVAPEGTHSPDPDDNHIIGSALAAGADLICTYNLRDFARSPVKSVAPISLIREYGDETDQHKCMYIVGLGDVGTILFVGRIHHPSSMDSIALSNNGTHVFADSMGFVNVCGPHALMNAPLAPLPAQQEFVMTIRYKCDHFEAAMWHRKTGPWKQTILSRARAQFSNMTQLTMFTRPDHKFFGHVQSLSCLPRFVRDNELQSALECCSLEAVTGSLGLRDYFNAVSVRRSRGGSW